MKEKETDDFELMRSLALHTADTFAFAVATGCVVRRVELMRQKYLLASVRRFVCHLVFWRLFLQKKFNKQKRLRWKKCLFMNVNTSKKNQTI